MNNQSQQSLDDRIMTLIIQNMDTGRKLPTERQLIQEWGVSRTALREAMKTFESNGLVMTKQGSGRYAQRPDIASQLENLWRILLKTRKGLLFDLLEIRSILEINSLPKVIERVDMEKLQEMNVQVQIMQEHARKGKSFAKQDREFHRLIFSCVGNELMEQLLSVFWALYMETGVERDHDNLPEVAEMHAKMLNALIKRDLEELTLLMRAQFEDARLQMVKFISENSKRMDLNIT